MRTVYSPVVSASSGHYHGKALVGTYSAIIAWSTSDASQRGGLRGFAIRRTDLDPETGEILRLDWLGGYKRFKETDDGQTDDVRSLEAPFQRFRWNDYTLNPERTYKYEVFPMRGDPGDLVREEPPLTFNVRPSVEDPGDLGVFVNRGVTAAMAYLARFKNTPPSEVPDGAAYRWLSRGLKESLLNFIAAARLGETLHVAIYEFFDHEIAQALKDASLRGVELLIVHDAKEGKKSTRENEEVISHFNLKTKRVKRTTVNISHNKLVIRLRNAVPQEVWSGSANFSENAFNFQTNTALIIRDPDAMQHYEDYFQALTGNPAKADSKTANRVIMDQANSPSDRFAEKTFFSPVRSLDILETSVELIRSAKSALFISAPFGVDTTMIDAMGENSDDIVEYGLANSTAKSRIASLHRKNTRFFTPKRLETYLGRSWDAKAFGAHKIHAKAIVVDPWGDDPKVLIGSANFSKASCRDNDENALLITGNKRLAAIIGTEFMRMYDHYKSRYYIDDLSKRGVTLDNHLKSDDSWSKTTFDPGSTSHKFRDRIVFAGG